MSSSHRTWFTTPVDLANSWPIATSSPYPSHTIAIMTLKLLSARHNATGSSPKPKYHYLPSASLNVFHPVLQAPHSSTLRPTCFLRFRRIGRATDHRQQRLGPPPRRRRTLQRFEECIAVHRTTLLGAQRMGPGWMRGLSKC